MLQTVYSRIDRLLDALVVAAYHVAPEHYDICLAASLKNGHKQSSAHFVVERPANYRVRISIFDNRFNLGDQLANVRHRVLRSGYRSQDIGARNQDLGSRSWDLESHES